MLVGASISLMLKKPLLMITQPLILIVVIIVVLALKPQTWKIVQKKVQIVYALIFWRDTVKVDQLVNSPIVSQMLKNIQQFYKANILNVLFGV